MSQKRLPPRLIGCLAPRLVEGPATPLSLWSESLELEAARLAFFGGGPADAGEGSDTADFSASFWASLGKSGPSVEWSIFLSAGAGTHAIGGIVGIVAFFRIRCSSSEFSVAEPSSSFGLDRPARGIANDRSCNLVPGGSSQSRTWIREVSVPFDHTLSSDSRSCALRSV
jgi:hypothetical protein